MSPMEQALRDEIAWLEGKLALVVGVAGPVSEQVRVEIRARLAALTAALPAPGVDAPGDWAMVQRAAAKSMLCAPGIDGLRYFDEIYAAMLAAAPSAPAEISQAQAQAMREAGFREGIEAAALLIEKQRDAWIHETWFYDPSTNAWEPPNDEADAVDNCTQDHIDAIRALAAAPEPPR